MKQLAHLSGRLVNSPWSEFFIIGVIIANGALLGLETSSAIDLAYGSWLHLGNQVALGVFIVEAALKMLALSPRPQRYFRDGWNIFDFLVIVFALIPATGQFAMITRLARLLRVVRLISTVKDLRLIVAALVRSIPSVGHVIMLMSIVVYIYAIMGYHLFHEHDPENWRTLGISVLTPLQHHHPGRLDSGHVHRHAAAPVGLVIFRQLRNSGHLRSHQPVHRHHHQQPGRSQDGAVEGDGNPGVPRGPAA